MKNIKSILLKLTLAMLALCLVLSSCTKDLLDQKATTELPASIFWKTEADATTGLMGAYAAMRPCFDRDFYFDGQGEYVRTRNGNNGTTSGNFRLGDAYRADYNPSGYGDAFGEMYRYLYGGVNRCNYVIENVENMKKSGVKASPEVLETIIGEAKLLRALAYFRLISMWGDVPYINKVIFDNSEVMNIARTPIGEVKDSILADLTFAFDKLPSTAATGRATKPAALALRGKVQLYWASWKKNGWPELEGFVQDPVEAKTAFTAAAADFDAVIKNYGLTLYMNGEPGQIDALGKANILPNYFTLFTPKANGNPEMILVFTHGGTSTGQGEELMREFGSRSTENAQGFMSPRYEIADRYQKISTGDFATPLVPSKSRTALNSAINPNSYADRDYRMKSTIMWDYEMYMSLAGLQETGFRPFIYKAVNAPVTIDGVKYTTVQYENINSGYIFRKFVRNYGGQSRSEGDYNWPVIRLADVFLMYAEASNEINATPQADAIALVNRVRARGKLPALAASKTANPTEFFNAIEQERIVELVGEGQRSFDLRRWRAIERVWGGPGSPGVYRIDTQGNTNSTKYFQNASDRVYEQCYIFKIPQGEIDRNPMLTQNKTWL